MQVVKNLVNRSGRRLTELFNQLNKRLKSTDEKSQLSGVRGERREGVQKKMRDKPTPETTASTAPAI